MEHSSHKGERRRRLDPEAAARIRAEARAAMANDAPAGAVLKADDPVPRHKRSLSAILSKSRRTDAPLDLPTAVPVVPRAPLQGQLRDNWDALRDIAVDARVLERNLIITAAREQHAHVAFDVLRTRMVQAMAERGWHRVAITSPTKGCGKSFTALNLTVALSRHKSLRTVLLDLDMRQPALSKRLGVKGAGAIGDLLRGETSPTEHLVRFASNGLHMGGNVALGLNDRAEGYASELLLQDSTAVAFARIEEQLAPDVMLFDMPPALAFDDAIALRDHVDCILMVVGAGLTTPRDLREAVRRLGEDKPVLGIVLNKADSVEFGSYSY